MSDQEDNQIENQIDNQANNQTEGQVNTNMRLTQEDKTWGMLCHIIALAGFLVPFGNIIGPLVVWLMKKDQMPFVDDQGKESLNFQITVAIAMVIGFILSFIGIGLVLLPLIGIYALVMVIIAGVAANNGTAYRYQFTYKFIK